MIVHVADIGAERLCRKILRDKPVIGWEIFSREMRVLLSNDDGIDANGLTALQSVAEHFFDEVWIVAPVAEASQIGHRVTTYTPIQYEERGNRSFAVHGTPADCTRIALAHLMPEKPDWIWSGINHGGNLGRHDFAISGTVAAVREAAFMGVKAMAASHYLKSGLDLDWPKAAERIAKVFSKIQDKETGFGEFWNVDLPHIKKEEKEPMLIFCEQEIQPLEVSFNEETPGFLNYTGRYHERPQEAGSDVAVCFGGDIAISKVSI